MWKSGLYLRETEIFHRMRHYSYVESGETCITTLIFKGELGQSYFLLVLVIRKVKTLLLQRCALRRFHVADNIIKTSVISLQVIESPNARDQIGFYALHSFIVEVQTLGT